MSETPENFAGRGGLMDGQTSIEPPRRRWFSRPEAALTSLLGANRLDCIADGSLQLGVIRVFLAKGAQGG